MEQINRVEQKVPIPFGPAVQMTIVARKGSKD